MKTKIILGIVGQMGAGKSTVADYIAATSHGSRYRFSGFLSEILEKLCIPDTRTNLIDLFLILAERFGKEVLARPMKEKVEADEHDWIVVEGIRRWEDISLLKELPNFYLLGVTSDEHIRYQRITKRREKTDDSQKTYKEFQADEQRPTETLIVDMIKQADYVITNDRDTKELEEAINNIIKEIKTKVEVV